MPHQIIEYSPNLSDRLEVDALVAHMHRAAARLDALPLAGLRTRAYPSARFAVADQHPDNAFVAVYLRIAEGRPVAVREHLLQTLSAALDDFMAQDFAAHPLALSYEIQEIETAMRWNHNNIREHLKERGHE